MPSNKTQTGKEAKPRTLANRYRVDRKLGSGSFGTVHLVEDLKSEDRWYVNTILCCSCVIMKRCSLAYLHYTEVLLLHALPKSNMDCLKPRITKPPSPNLPYKIELCKLGAPIHKYPCLISQNIERRRTNLAGCIPQTGNFVMRGQ